jgi:predicted DNA-binding transcriptional regulator AlpA
MQTNQTPQPLVYLRLRDLRLRYRVSASTIWKWAANPQSGFPKPVKLGANTTAWCLTELLAWEASRKAIATA